MFIRITAPQEAISRTFLIVNKSQPETKNFEQAKYQAKIEMVDKLRQIGLSNEQIAETLGLALEKVKQVNSEG